MDFLLIDFEFTFYKKPFGRPRTFFSEIIEIGAVKLNGETLMECGKLQDFVKPQFFPKQAADAMNFCMITPNDMKKAITFPKMMEKLAELYVPGETYFVTWGDCDYKVLSICCEKYKVNNPIRPEDCLDLAEAYKIMKGEENTPGLKASAQELGVNADGLWHTALDDACNTGKILLKLFDLGWSPKAYFDAKAEAAEAARIEKEIRRARWLERKNQQYVE